MELARFTTGAQLERLAGGVGRASKPAEDALDPERAACQMRTRTRYDEDGTMVLTVRLPAEHGAVVLAAIVDAGRAELDRLAAQTPAFCGRRRAF